MSDKILSPFGAIDRQAPVFAAALALAIYDRNTVVDLAVTTAAVEVDLTVDSETPDGARLTLIIPQDATGYNITLDAGFSANPGVTGVASDTDVVEAVYNASSGNFDVVSVFKKVNAA